MLKKCIRCSSVKSGLDKAIFLWDVLSTKVTRRIWGHDARVNSLAYHVAILSTGTIGRISMSRHISVKNESPRIVVLSNPREAQKS